MKFVNLTPHKIVVRADGFAEFAIETSDSVARCQVVSEKVADLNGFVPVLRQVFGTPQGIPEPVEGTVYVCSTLVAQSAGREDVVSPDTGPTAYRENGQVVAVRQFQNFAPSVNMDDVRNLAEDVAAGFSDVHGHVVGFASYPLAKRIVAALAAK